MDKERLKIIWTKNAVEDYNRVINYLVHNWSEKVANNFDKIIKTKLHLLVTHPFVGQSSTKIQNVRSILLTKHNRLYYRIKRNQIQLLNILDTRQNPTKNPY